MSDNAQLRSSADAPIRIAGRYEVRELLGRGGMASVYRVHDAVNDTEVALKQVQLGERADQNDRVTALFEREYHVLSELRHPRVIAVHDYGAGTGADSGPYYTMELLAGGDLRDRTPVAWQQACALLFDVCSSLALLHSRRLLHRDVTPRNVRCGADGRAKLIDFGAMMPIGVGTGAIVGTPAFLPPEVLHRSALDPRADLFSLGATLYYALTRRMPYPARTFAEVQRAWQVSPAPPSAYVDGIPAALDDLVLSLLQIEPALRPRTAFEVMQRLAAIAGFECEEPEEVSRAYLTAPLLVGRGPALEIIRAQLKRALSGRGGGLLIRGAAGVGRTRVLDACALMAKTMGAIVLRASANGVMSPFAIASRLLEDLSAALPEGGAKEPATIAQGTDPALRQQAICDHVLGIAARHALLIAVDDVQRIDQASAAVLATLTDSARRANLLVALTCEESALGTGLALEVLARRCAGLQLETLTGEQTEELLGSVFGQVPNLALVASELYGLTRGNPRQTMDLAQHLLDRDLIRYVGGTFELPNQLAAGDLPKSAEEAIRARVEALPELARFLGQAQAIAFHELWRLADYHALVPDADARAVDAALSALLSAQALTGDGELYALANRAWVAAFTASLGPEPPRAHHRALAAMYRRSSPSAVIHHLFEGGLDEQALDALIARHAEYAEKFDSERVIEMNAARLGPSYVRAIETALALHRPARDIHELRRWQIALSVLTDARDYWHSAPAWLEQLKQDSGFTFWESDSANTEPGPRLMQALTRAQQRHEATAEHDRGYRVDEAIRFLAQYVAFSIAIAARTVDNALYASLPPVLEPFAPLSPLVDALQQNAIATCESTITCRYERARARWREVLDKLERVQTGDMQHVHSIRSAVSYGIGMLEATMGLPSAASWADRIEHDSQHRVSALQLRRIVRIEQGDVRAAEQLRRDAELHALRARAPQMFNTLLVIELYAHAQTRDLAGVREVIGRLEPIAARYPGWMPHLTLARAHFERVRGDLPAARQAFERCVELTEWAPGQMSPFLAVWIWGHAGVAETLLDLDRPEEARRRASAALATCRELGVEVLDHDLARVLALCCARLGDIGPANDLLDGVLAKQTELGVAGLKLGLTLEAHARVAIASGDEAAFEEFARRAAEAYRYGTNSPLGARCARLLQDAKRKGFESVNQVAEFEASTMFEGDSGFGDVTATRTRKWDREPD